MRGTVQTVAQLTSTAPIDLPFPYSGGSHGVIALRKIGSFRQITFQVTNGRFNVTTDTLTLRTKADSGLVQTWRASPSKNNDLTIAIIRQTSPFVRSLSMAREFIVEAEFFGAGRRQFVFAPQGLDLLFLS